MPIVKAGSVQLCFNRNLEMSNCLVIFLARLRLKHFTLPASVKDRHRMTPDNLKNDFDEICKGTIIPFFKELGFKKKTLHFSRQINDITQCFNVQKSQWNSYHDIVDF